MIPAPRVRPARPFRLQFSRGHVPPVRLRGLAPEAVRGPAERIPRRPSPVAIGLPLRIPIDSWLSLYSVSGLVTFARIRS